MAKPTNNNADNSNCRSPVNTNGTTTTPQVLSTQVAALPSGGIDNNNNNNNNNNNDNLGNKQLRIAVGTTNPCKIDAVKKAVEKAMKFSANANNRVELHVQGFSVESAVSDQPFGDVR
jgi:hypothetical protein